LYEVPRDARSQTLQGALGVLLEYLGGTEEYQQDPHSEFADPIVDAFAIPDPVEGALEIIDHVAKALPERVETVRQLSHPIVGFSEDAFDAIERYPVEATAYFMGLVKKLPAAANVISDAVKDEWGYYAPAGVLAAFWPTGGVVAAMVMAAIRFVGSISTNRYAHGAKQDSLQDLWESGRQASVGTDDERAKDTIHTIYVGGFSRLEKVVYLAGLHADGNVGPTLSLLHQTERGLLAALLKKPIELGSQQAQLVSVDEVQQAFVVLREAVEQFDSGSD